MGASILLVEDNRDVAEMFKLGLSIVGHDVLTADDGTAAVEMVRRRRFDLVLLDVQLPRMDGLSALSLLRSSPSTQRQPVAMLTNCSDEALRRRAYSLGIIEWLIKSETTPTDLARRITAWFLSGFLPSPWQALDSRGPALNP